MVVAGRGNLGMQCMRQDGMQVRDGATGSAYQREGGLDLSEILRPGLDVVGTLALASVPLTITAGLPALHTTYMCMCVCVHG